MGGLGVDSPAARNNRKPGAPLRCFHSHFIDEKNEVQRGEVPAKPDSNGART